MLRLPKLLSAIVVISTGCYEFEIRERQLASLGLDVQSCLHFLHYLFSTWLRPQVGEVKWWSVNLVE